MSRCILVYRIGQLGDTLISMPAISAIRRHHPDHRLVLLTETQPVASSQVSAWDVLQPTEWFDDVMFYTPGKNMAHRIMTMFSLAKKIRKLKPDIVYDLAPERTRRQAARDRFFFKSFSGIRDYRGGGFLAKPVKNAQGFLPRIEPEWKRLLRLVNKNTETADFQFFIPLAEKQRAHELLQRAQLTDKPRIVAIGPGSKMPSKIWAKEKFRELGQRLLKDDSELQLLVVGGKEDIDLGDELCAAWGQRSHNFAGRFSIYGSAAALQRCVAYIGNDTGAMHIAGMVGLPCVALFSARDYPGQWEPYGADHLILRHETECAGCMLTVCPFNNKCLSFISIDVVESALKSIITRH